MSLNKTDTKVKRFGIILGELLTIGTVVFLITTKQYSRLPLAFGTLGLILLPAIMEKKFRCRLCLPVYMIALWYAVGPMMGQCWNFYYTISCWDKLLHICGGVMFAIVGAYFFELLTKRRDHFVGAAIFALCFSVTIAALWEFIEFGADRFLGMDMQDDMLVKHLTSYLLGEGIGVTGSIENIHSVVVNGTQLPGYIDIGLTDSMLDMMLGSLGALGTCLMILFDKGKHPMIRNVHNLQDAGRPVKKESIR